MAATSHPLATGVALDILKAGGNALDAAIAASAALAVVEPQSTGIGGDCFALISLDGGDDITGYNGSGRSPAGLDLGYFTDRGLTEIAAGSVHSVTLPGAVEAWSRLHTDHGRLPFEELMRPAVAYARDGYAVHARVRYDWLRAEQTLQGNAASRALFLPGGEVPAEGAMHRQPALADTLEAIGSGGAAAFYGGPIAAAMAKSLAAAGGLHTLDDFAAVAGDYVKPASVDYRGHRVHQIPPNNQGMTALLMLNLLEGFDLGSYAPLSVERTHLEIEAGRLAYAVRDAAIGDPATMTANPEWLLSKEWAARLRKAIRLDRALPNLPDLALSKSDTVYLTVVDRDRMAVSFINSVYHSFGSGILCPETGVMFQNRGKSFKIDPLHPNRVGPSKRPMHTIMPGMVTRNGRAMLSYGVMGGDYQPFGHARLLTNVIDYGLDPQAGLDMPRVFASGGEVEAERPFPEEVVRGLAARGHVVKTAAEPLGGGQAILIDHASGVLTGGSDPRKDGCALGY